MTAVEKPKTKKAKEAHEKPSELNAEKEARKMARKMEKESATESVEVVKAKSKKIKENPEEESSPGSSDASTSADATNLIASYRVSKESLKALKKKGIETFFPIQEKSFDAIYDGKHVIGRARTGTGKTLALSLPSIEYLMSVNAFSDARGNRHANCLILVLLPTRELAQQVAAEFTLLECGRYGTATVVGGLPEDPQLRTLREKGNVVVATPGRAIDFLTRGLMSLNHVRILILDEADQMLEMGFREDVDAILEHVANQKEKAAAAVRGADKKDSIKVETVRPALQVLLFTATLPSWIAALSSRYMSTGEKIVVDVVKGQEVQTALGVRHLGILCGWQQRAKILDVLVGMYGGGPSGRAIIFTETKAQANEIAMDSSISSLCQVLHGDIQQRQRETTLKAFKDGRFKCLVATDVAARGIHVDGVSLVIHIEPPKDVDTFVHRSGRTGRAGTAGTNIVLFRSLDAPFLLTIERATGCKFQRVGIPQPADMLKSAAVKLAQEIAAGSSGAMEEATKEAANLLIAEIGPTEAVSRLLCQLSGLTNVKGGMQISILSGRENFKSYEIVFKSAKINTKSYVWQALNNAFGGEKFTSKVGTLMLRADSTGAVFDLPQEITDEFDKKVEAVAKQTRNAESFTVRVLTELPEIYDPHFDAANVPVSYDSKNPNSRSKRFREANGGYNKKGGNGNGGQGGGAYKQQRTNSGGGNKRW